MSERKRIYIEIELPAGVNSRSFVSNLGSWLTRYSALLCTWSDRRHVGRRR